jgi:hypothetical protein
MDDMRTNALLEAIKQAGFITPPYYELESLTDSFARHGIFAPFCDFQKLNTKDADDLVKDITAKARKLGLCKAPPDLRGCHLEDIENGITKPRTPDKNNKGIFIPRNSDKKEKGWNIR